MRARILGGLGWLCVAFAIGCGVAHVCARVLAGTAWEAP